MPDTTPPTLIGVFPANGSTVPNQQTSFFLMFDETLGAAPIIKLTLPDGVSPLTPWIDLSGNVASYNPSFWMPGVWTFTVQDGSVRDVDGKVDPGKISSSVSLADGLPNVAPYMVAMQFGPAR